MRRPLFLLLLACAAARGGELELAKPSDDWDTVSPDAKSPGLKAHLRTGREGDGASIRLYVDTTKKPLDEWVAAWRDELGKQLGAKPDVGDGKLAGAACRVVDGRNEFGHVTAWVVRRGDRIVALHVVREGDAVGDADIEAEIARVRDALVLPADAPAPEAKPKPDGKPAAKPAEPSPREEIALPFWRLELVKPRGLERAAELDESEKANGVVVKLTAKDGQRRCWIRVYAHPKAQAKPAAQVLEARRKHLLDLYEGRKHEEREVAKWKPPLAKKELRFGLVGKRDVAETWRWHVLDCRNDRQYEVEIFTTGAWDAEIKDFLDHFRPVRGG